MIRERLYVCVCVCGKENYHYSHYTVPEVTKWLERTTLLIMRIKQKEGDGEQTIAEHCHCAILRSFR